MDYLTEQARLREEVVQASKVTLFDISISLQYFNISSLLQFPFISQYIFSEDSSPNVNNPKATLTSQVQPPDYVSVADSGLPSYEAAIRLIFILKNNYH